MQPELKRLCILASDLPEDRVDCCVPMSATIGPLGDLSGDDFHFTVATTKHVANNWPFWGRQAMIVDVFDQLVIERAVRSLLSDQIGPNWPAIAGELHQFMAWEFHNYQASIE